MEALHISIPSETLFHLAGVPVTNSMVTGLLVSLGIMVVCIALGMRAGRRQVPGPFMNAGEAVVETMYLFIESMVGSRDVAMKIFPLVMTFFLFILVNNWVALVPGISAVVLHTGDEAAPLLRSATSDLNTTIALALITVIMAQAYGIMHLGMWSHVKKYISWNPIKLFVGGLEFLSEGTRLISFSFRLFGSVFAGEVLLIVIGSFVPLVAPIPFLILEVLFGFIQAVVFSMLTIIFIKMAVTSHEPSDSG